MSEHHYIAVVHKEDDTDYGVMWPDIPGCITTGETMDEAVRMAHEALQGHLDWMVRDGDPIPAPSSIITVATHPDAQGAVAFVPIKVDVPETVSRAARKINITIDEGLLGLVDTEAGRRGMSRSAFLAEGARRLISEAHRGIGQDHP